MTAYLLIWNPGRGGWDEGELKRGIEITATGGTFDSRWSTGSRRQGIERGDELYLLRLGVEPRGLVGYGLARDAIFIDEHWEDPSTDSPYVAVEWHVLLDEGDELPIADLQREIPTRTSWEPQGSGTVIEHERAELLAALWKGHLESLGQEPLPDPPSTGTDAPRAGHRQVQVRARIGQGGFRDILIRKYGNICAITGPAPLEALEAAHLFQYAEHAHHDPDGGLLLRSDIHALFDRHLLKISPAGVVGVHDSLQPYETYWDLRGSRLKVTLSPGQQKWLRARRS